MRLTDLHIRQRGLSLIELMIGMAVGLVILAGVLTVYISTIQSSSATVKSIRLNQEMNAVLDVMMSDITRAGYWSNATDQIQNIQTVSNPFTAATTDLRVLDGGRCLLFTYDFDADGLVTASTDEMRGYRLNVDTNEIQTIQGITGGVDTTTCPGDHAWQSLTDRRTSTITDLTFTLNEKCSNITDTTIQDCTNPVNIPASGDLTVHTREVVISMTGELTDDNAVRKTLQESVKIRNDAIKVTP